MSAAPRLVTSRSQLTDALGGSSGPRSLGLVPTMGALHEGHAELMRRARERSDVVVASVFVNPMQFGAGEDLARYPRTLEDDLDLAGRCGVDLVFAPAVEEVYPGGDPQVTVDPGPLAGVLEGVVRPTHFRGVLTVVAKLFGLVRPDLAFFGEKDYQQLVLVRRMVADLCLGIEVVGVETVREADGLAMSSRNAYLDPEQRKQAVALSRTLRAAAEVSAYGPQVALDAARAELRRSPGVDLDYLQVTDPDLGPAPDSGAARLLIAARVGTTRLIDNLALDLGTGPEARPASIQAGDR